MLSPGEITVGMTITVLEWTPVVHEPDAFSALMTGVTTATTHRDNSWCGDVLDVEAVQLPYLIVREGDGVLGHGFKIDTRRAKLMELSPEYVAAKTRRTA